MEELEAQIGELRTENDRLKATLCILKTSYAELAQQVHNVVMDNKKLNHKIETHRHVLQVQSVATIFPPPPSPQPVEPTVIPLPGNRN